MAHPEGRQAYLREMLVSLEGMARAAGLPFLAFLISMAAAEAARP